MFSQRLVRGLLALAAAAVVVLLVLMFRPEWWRGELPRPEFNVYLAVQEPRESLMDRFRSYDSEQQVRQQLAGDGLEITAERVHVEGTRRYPPYKLDILTVNSYQHLGHEGRLDLEFFNDRLAGATFQPTDPKPYLRQVQKAGVRMKRQELSRWTHEAGHLRVSSNIVYATSKVGQTLSTPPYVSWQDMRLVAQSREWYAAYGSRYAIAPIRTLGPGSAP